jgi:hypothetical protein
MTDIDWFRVERKDRRKGRLLTSATCNAADAMKTFKNIINCERAGDYSWVRIVNAREAHVVHFLWTRTHGVVFGPFSTWKPGEPDKPLWAPPTSRSIH